MKRRAFLTLLASTPALALPAIAAPVAAKHFSGYEVLNIEAKDVLSAAEYQQVVEESVFISNKAALNARAQLIAYLEQQYKLLGKGQPCQA